MEWWKMNCHSLPPKWSAAVKQVTLVQPSSAAADSFFPSEFLIYKATATFLK